MGFIDAVTDYSGRQVDVELLQTIPHPVVLRRVQVSNIYDTPKIVAGVQKLAQRYALLLLTAKGFVNFAQEQGSELIAQLMSGKIKDRGRLQHEFAKANARVLNQLRKDARDTTTFGTIPADEQLRSATLLDYEIDFASSSVFLRVKLVTRAGTSLEFIVPAKATR